ncbi:MAG: DegV family protein [Firmicutes bacterium]|jgi:DegV family protein with EDD domain|nr:DegV family protein [Bacillota bacterium]
MEKIAIVGDSAANFRKGTVDEFGIYVLPYRIIYEDREYRDGIDIDENYVYDHLDEEIPTTSFPSLNDIHDLYDRLVSEGFTHVIAVTLSSGLSGMHQAMSMVSEEYSDKINSFIFDSKSISIGEGILMEEIGKMVKEGLKFENIVEKLASIKDRIRIFFVFGTLEYIIKGGRIGKVAGTVGEILNIKPIVSIDEDGKYFTYEKVRGRKKSLKRFIDIGKEMLDENRKVFVMEGRAHEEAMKVHDALKEYGQKINKGYVEFIGNLSTVQVVHTGPGFLGIGTIKE